MSAIRCRISAISLFWLISILCCAWAVAQPTPLKKDSPTNGGVERSELETFYLKDKDGKLIPFINVPFEEFEEVYKLYKKLKAPDQRQRYRIESLAVQGSVDGRLATLDFTFSIVTHDVGWVRIPLRLNNAVLSVTGKELRSQRQFLDFDEKGDGYVCWIRGAPDERHTVKLKGIVKTRTAGGKTHLSLNLPQRLTDSQLKLQVPGRRIKPEVAGEALVNRIEPVGREHTALTILNIRGGFEVAWQESTAAATSPPPLHVAGKVLVEFIGQKHIRCIAILSVRSSKDEFDTFIVRLSPGMRMSQNPVEQSGYTLRPVNRPVGPGDNPKTPTQFVEVKLDEKTTGPKEVQLVAELNRTDAESKTAAEVAGFQVLGTPFQTGHFNLAIKDDWSMQPTEGANVFRVENIDAELRRKGVVASFAYDAQPCSLKVQVFRKRKHVTIEPHYVLHVEPEQVRLEAKLKCKLRGAKVDSINIDMSGWDVDEIQPAEIIDGANIQTEQVSPLAVHLSPAARSTTGEVEITILARRKLDAAARKSSKWSVNLPHPEASSLSPATLIVRPAENVVLSPVQVEFKGLVPDSPSSPMPPSVGRQAPLYYREQAESGPSVFVSEFEVRKRSGLATVETELRLTDKGIQVRQNLSYLIEFEPLGHVLLDVPVSTLRSRNFEIKLNGNPLKKWDELVEDSEWEIQDGWKRVRVDLAGNHLGVFELVVSYLSPSPANSETKQSTTTVPLVGPVESGELSTTFMKLLIEPSDRQRATPDDNHWKLSDDEIPSSTGSLSYIPASDEFPTNVQLQLTLRDVPLHRPTVVRQGWVQTWLTNAGRQERAVFHITTNEDRVRIRLPNGAVVNDAALDGRRIKDGSLAQSDEAVVNLPAGADLRDHVIELWYSFENGRPPRGWFSLDLPQIQDVRWTKRFYWQLVLPPDEHLLHVPSELTAELTWNWQGLYWGRRASLTQQDLEQRTSATRQASLSDATNQYVFSSFGDVVQIHLATASRRSVVLAVSLVALFGGMLLIYFPSFRHPISLFVGGLVLVAVGVAYPEPALQLAQAACIGVALVIAAQLLKWSLARPREARAIIRGTSRSDFGASISGAILPRADEGSQTSTAALSVHLVEPESKR